MMSNKRIVVKQTDENAQKHNNFGDRYDNNDESRRG